MSICSVLFVTGNIRMTWDILMFTRLKWGNKYTNIAPQTLTPPSRVRSGPWTQATTQAPNSGPHTASLSSSQAQPLCWSEAKNIPAPQDRLCAFTESHCVPHSNTCTYFSMVSLDSTTCPSLHTRVCCLSPSGEIREHKSELSTKLWLLVVCCWQIHLHTLKILKTWAVGKKHKNKMWIIQLLSATWNEIGRYAFLFHTNRC